MKPNFFSKWMSQAFCLSTVLSFVAQPLLPAFATDPIDYSRSGVSAGDTAKTLPDVDKICDAVDNALAGNFVGKDGKTELKTVLKPECANLSRAELAARGAGACYTTMSERISSACKGNCTDEQREKAITATCQSGAGNSDDAVGTYCAIHSLSKTDTQTKSYCTAYKEAKKAQGSTSIVALLDTVAAGACWAEYLSMKKAVKQYDIDLEKWRLDKNNIDPTGKDFRYTGAVGPMAPGSIMTMGICGGAALTASAGEIFQTVKVFLGNHSGGNKIVNSNNNVVGYDGILRNIPKTVEVIASSFLSLAGVRIGLCYYGKKIPIWKTMCDRLGDVSGIDRKGLKASKETLDKAKADKDFAETARDGGKILSDAKLKYGNVNFSAAIIPSLTVALEGCTQSEADKAVNKCAKVLDEAGRAHETIKKAYVARARMAHQAAIVYTGLAAMRAVAIGAAEVTKSKTTTILQSMFASGNGGPTVAGTAMNSSGANLFSLTGSLGFTSETGSNSGRTSASTASASPESYMLPPSSAAEAAAQSLAKQISKSAMDNAASGGAAGVAGMMASIASAAGGKDMHDEISNAVKSAFANVPQESGGYGGSSGGRALSSSKSDSGGDLNLKSLFGGAGESAEQAAAGSDMAFRELASEDDIWHSKNPKGNNLFQMVSDKYGTVQMKHSLGN